jgi:hypothetical protein
MDAEPIIEFKGTNGRIELHKNFVSRQGDCYGFHISRPKGRSKSREIRVIVAIVSAKAGWTLSVLWYKW